MVFYLNPFSIVFLHVPFLETQFCWGFYLPLHSHVLTGGRDQLCLKKGICDCHELPLLILDWGMGRYVVYIRQWDGLGVVRLLGKNFLHLEIRHKEQRLVLLLLVVSVAGSTVDVYIMTATMPPGLELSWHAGECRKTASWCCWSAD